MIIAVKCVAYSVTFASLKSVTESNVPVGYI